MDSPHSPSQNPTPHQAPDSGNPEVELGPFLDVKAQNPTTEGSEPAAQVLTSAEDLQEDSRSQGTKGASGYSKSGSSSSSHACLAHGFQRQARSRA